MRSKLAPGAHQNFCQPTLRPDAPAILLANAVEVRDTESCLYLKELEYYEHTTALVSKISNQLLHGCGDRNCSNEACYSYQKRIAVKPLRKLSQISARAQAVYIASQRDAENYVCSSKPPDANDESTEPTIRLVRSDGRTGWIGLYEDSNPRTSLASTGHAPSCKIQKFTTNGTIGHVQDNTALPHSDKLKNRSKNEPTAVPRNPRKDPKSFSQYVFDHPKMKLLDEGYPKSALSDLRLFEKSQISHCLDHVTSNIISALYDLLHSDCDCPRIGTGLQIDFQNEIHMRRDRDVAFARQSCFYVFSRCEGILASYRQGTEFKWPPSSKDSNLAGLLYPPLPHLVPSEIESDLKWLHSEVGDLLPFSLLKALEDFKPTIEEDEQIDEYPADVHILMICILGLISAPIGIRDDMDSVPGDSNSLLTIESCTAQPILNLAERLVELIYTYFKMPTRIVNKQRTYFPRLSLFWSQLRHSCDSYSPLLLQLRHWVRTVFMTNWDGHPTMSHTGVTGKALMVLRWLYFDEKRNQLTEERDYQPHLTKYIDSLDIARSKARLDDSTSWDWHILEFPWLLPQASLIETFRAQCFIRMAAAVDKSDIVLRLLSNRSINSTQSFEACNEVLKNAIARCSSLNVNRDNLLTDTFDQLWRREERELLRPLKVRIQNSGEEGVDEGGVAQEFFRLVFAEACGPAYGLFAVDPNTRMMWFNPSCVEPLWRYELLGLLTALAVYNGFATPFTLPNIFYGKLLNRDTPGIQGIRDGWPELYNGFTSLLSWEGSDVEEVFMRTYEFSFEFYGKIIDINMELDDIDIPWGYPVSPTDYESDKFPEAGFVTNDNRSQYVAEYIFWLTQKSIQAQYESFEKGFYTILNYEMIKHLEPGDLKILIEGHHDITTQELRRVTRYDGGYTRFSPLITQFWRIFKSYSQQDKRRLLQFVTATDRIPVLGYDSLEFFIQRNGPDSEQLPSSHTCFGRLLLPEYSSERKLRDKLRIALDNSIGFGLR